MPDYDIALEYKPTTGKEPEILHISAEPETLVGRIASCGCLGGHFKDILQLTVYNKSKPVPEKPTG